MLKQAIEKRKKETVDEGTMGFHDYVDYYTETFEEFVNKITKKYNRNGLEVLSINYIGKDKAVISYKETK